MTTASRSHTGAAALRGDGRAGWLYGPAVDLLIGAGAGYLVSIPLLVLAASVGGITGWPVAVAALFGLLISGPHYGATILRVYEQRDDRRKYAFFAVWATLLLCALFVIGLHDVTTGSLLVTAYATWSPWHFSGQNYGLALMFLRRRGVPVEPRAKRLVYASFVLCYALTFLLLHGESYVVSYASVEVSEASLYRFMSLGIPAEVVRVAVPVTAAAWLLALAGSAALLLRGAHPRDLLPAACLVLVQALWFGLPASLHVMANAPLQGLAFTAIWVSAAHAAQYLWVTSYYARREDPSLRVGGYLARALLAGSAVTLFPALVFAPGLLGRVPWDLGLAILLFSVVNLHHFVLDGAIWKLRDGRVARLLLRDAAGEREAPAPATARRTWLRPALTALGLASLGVAGVDVWQREFVINRAGADIERVLRGAQRLAWIGRDHPSLHTQTGLMLAARGDSEAAIAELRRSLELYPTSEAWLALGRVEASRARWEEASDAYARALALAPDDVSALAHAGVAWLELGRPDLARHSLERASALAPEETAIRRELERAIAAEARAPGTAGGAR